MSNPKELRKQLRNVVQDLLPGLISTELCQAVYKKVQEENAENFKRIEGDIKNTLTALDTRSKDIQTYIMRQVAEQLSRETSMPLTSPAQNTQPDEDVST